MIYQQLYDSCKKKNSVYWGLIGSGDYGTEIVAQSIKHPLLKIPIIADCNIEAARTAYKNAGISDGDIIRCDNRSSTLRAMEAGKFVIVDDPMILMELPLDVIAEATGIPEAGARHAYEAIRNGKHVAMVNKETDSVIGPILKYMADRASVVYTAVDGDQHGLLMGLLSWARSLDFEIICGGKFRDFEFLYDKENRTVAFDQKVIAISEKDAWAMDMIPDGKADLYVKKRREILSGLPYSGVGGYDICELTIIANTTGLVPEISAMHNPYLRISEIPSVLCPVNDGGILNTSGVLDAVTCIKEKGDVSGGGGVFIVVSCNEEYLGRRLAPKLISNSNGSAALIYRPYHLTGIETLTSILCAGLLNIPTGSNTVLPHYDMIRRSARYLKAGHILGGDHDQDIESLILPACAVSKGNPLPAHMTNGNKLTRDIPSGTLITSDMVEAPSDSILWSLRKQQDEHFMLRR